MQSPAYPSIEILAAQHLHTGDLEMNTDEIERR